MTLTVGQQGQIKRQLAAHQHARYETDIELDTGEFLENFIVYPYVLRPETVAAGHLARWLKQHPELYQDKVALDMGSGSGIQGVVMGSYGASWVVFSDVYPPAVANTRANVLRFDLAEKAKVFWGDLFEKIESQFDLIVFNHPFFADDPRENEPVSGAMLDSGELLQRFLREAQNYLQPGGLIVMPFWHFAGATNDPAKYVDQYGLEIAGQDIFDLDTELHQGPMSVYQLQYES